MEPPTSPSRLSPRPPEPLVEQEVERLVEALPYTLSAAHKELLRALMEIERQRLAATADAIESRPWVQDALHTFGDALLRLVRSRQVADVLVDLLDDKLKLRAPE